MSKNPLRYENMFPGRNIKYTQSGDIDLRCQAGRDFKTMTDNWDAADQETLEQRQRILDSWAAMDPVDQSEHILSNSEQYRLTQYAKNTAVEEQEYYINSEGNLTTWSLDRTINKIKLSDFLSKQQSSNLVADKLI